MALHKAAHVQTCQPYPKGPLLDQAAAEELSANGFPTITLT